MECSQDTWHDEGIILSKAAKIVRRFLFSKEETFDGDLSKQRQKESVPLPLVNLISLIIDGETNIEDASTNAAAVATNLAQILRFFCECFSVMNIKKIFQISLSSFN